MIAHPYILAEGEDGGEMATMITDIIAVETVECETFGELDAAATAFGKAHSPCNVWITCESKPAPVGFAELNTNLSAYVFDAAGERIQFGPDGNPLTPEAANALDDQPDAIDGAGIRERERAQDERANGAPEGWQPESITDWLKREGPSREERSYSDIARDGMDA
jgi:hypothetical protein